MNVFVSYVFLFFDSGKFLKLFGEIELEIKFLIGYYLFFKGFYFFFMVLYKY